MVTQLNFSEKKLTNNISFRYKGDTGKGIIREEALNKTRKFEVEYCNSEWNTSHNTIVTHWVAASCILHMNSVAFSIYATLADGHYLNI